ncbi:MAG: hypothetical protein NC122_04155 [Faecalibacterium sp.]|nr:hypothetical protein [Ruminococcus sp.]MCM1392933.1 hypothetical protein [Ruminococcus sp.]MCM1485377.1 hypothetical protein [Faecalibacterium sp.]
MTFISLSFIAFLAITVLAFYICPVKHRWIVLLLASVIFYAICGVQYLPFILLTSITTYFGGGIIGKTWSKQKDELAADNLSRDDKKAIKNKFKKKAKTILLATLILNVFILCAVKFAKFFIDPINNLIDGDLSVKNIIVPLGISYYTFSALSYLLDVYWKRFEYEKNYFRFALYLIYFPHILQGPIENYSRLGQQLKKELRFDSQRIIYAVELILWGYFKKLVIADRLNLLVNNAFNNCGKNYGIFYIVAAVFDVFYIYADFSGCMDIARGVSQIFGIELDLNFDHPFLSKSVAEFWRRWHISLGAWFRDYVYYPISTSSLIKNINKKLRAKNVSPKIIRAICAIIPISVTWILTGLWHGTGKTYVAWGIYYAALISMSTVFSEPFQNLLHKLHIKTDTVSWSILQSVKVFLIFMGGRLLTSPGSLSNTIIVLRSVIYNHNFWIFTNGSLWSFAKMDETQFIISLAAIVLLIAVDIIQSKSDKTIRERISQENLFTRLILVIGLIIVIAVFGIYGSEYNASSFAYMAY